MRPPGKAQIIQVSNGCASVPPPRESPRVPAGTVAGNRRVTGQRARRVGANPATVPPMSRIRPAHPLTSIQARRLWLHAQRLDTPAPFGDGPGATAAAVAHLG